MGSYFEGSEDDYHTIEEIIKKKKRRELQTTPVDPSNDEFLDKLLEELKKKNGPAELTPVDDAYEPDLYDSSTPVDEVSLKDKIKRLNPEGSGVDFFRKLNYGKQPTSKYQLEKAKKMLIGKLNIAKQGIQRVCEGLADDYGYERIDRVGGLVPDGYYGRPSVYHRRAGYLYRPYVKKPHKWQGRGIYIFKDSKHMNKPVNIYSQGLKPYAKQKMYRPPIIKLQRRRPLPNPNVAEGELVV